VKPGPQTIIAAGQTSAPGMRLISMARPPCQERDYSGGYASRPSVLASARPRGGYRGLFRVYAIQQLEMQLAASSFKTQRPPGW
jgi:hypothetical protein